jgi:hypothetical protein
MAKKDVPAESIGYEGPCPAEKTRSLEQVFPTLLH